MVSRPGRTRVFESFKIGVTPSDFLYGYDVLAERFDGAGILEIKRGDSAPAKLAEKLEEKWHSFFGFRLRIFPVLKQLPEIGKASVTYSHIDNLGMTLAFLKAFGVFNPGIVHVYQGAVDVFQKDGGFLEKLKLELGRFIDRQIDIAIVLGDGAKQRIDELFYPSKSRHRCLQYGVDLGFWSDRNEANQTDRPYVVMIGSDANRDVQTLLDADLEIPVKIVSKLIDKKGLSSGYEKVEPEDTEALRTLIEQAELSIVPLKECFQPSGQSTALQSMACGTGVVLSNTDGLWDVHSLVDEETVFLVDAENPIALRNRVIEIMQNPSLKAEVEKNAKRLVSEKYDSRVFGKKLANGIQNLMRDRTSLVV